MTKACLWLACSLVLVAWPPRVPAETLLAEQEGPEGTAGDEDSLRPAIEVLSRRQRDLAGRQQPYGNYGSGLLRYHYEPARRSSGDSDNLEFLSGVEEEGVGQPEDIGYGYQRGYGGGLAGGRDEGSLREQQAAAGARVLENLLREYLERGRLADEEGPGASDDEDQAEENEKRSAFRERGGEAAKRGGGRFVGPPLAGSSFRERLIQELEGGGDEAGGEDEGPEDEEDERRKRLLAVIKRLEEEGEEGGEEEGEEGARGEEEADEEGDDDRRRKRVRGGEDDDSGPGADSKLAAYMDLLENLWEKYEAEKAAEEYNDEKGLEAKRARSGRGRKYSDGGPTFDHFNSPMGWMGGGGGGGGGFDGFGRRRRNGGGRLRAYSSPFSRERGWFVDAEGPDVPQEAHRKRQFFRRADERWDGEGAEDEEVGLSPEEWGAALEAGGGGGLILPSRQRRFPVAKRSSKRVLMPAGVEGERRKRRESGKEAKTDPKVAQVLSQIFENGGEKTNETKETANKDEESNKMKKKAIPAEKKDEEKRKRKKASEDSARATTEASEGVKEDKKKAILKAKKKREGEGEVAATVGEPETVKREKTEVKKSVDWSQYFGIDRRRKKSGGDQGEKENKQGEGEEEEEGDKKRKREEGEGKDNKEKEGEEEKLDDWLLNQYYKTLAMSTNIVKRGGGGLKSRRPHAGAVVEAEEAGDEGGLDAMDGKLRRVEDAIVEEAIKDTGAHMGGPQGSAEGVRERVLSRLAAAYSLEKMRKALGEFKANLREEEEEDEEEAKGGGGGHPMMPSEPDMERERRRGSGGREGGAEGAFVGPPLAAPAEPPMSEGYMGGRIPVESNEVSGGECPALERLATNCQGIGDLAGDYQHLFLDLCNWHEVCYICGSSATSTGISSCDITFLREVDSLCHGHEGCRQSGRRMAVALRALRGRGGKHLHQHQSKSASVCWQHPCLADYLARRRRR